MIAAIESYDKLVISLRSLLVTLSELDGKLVKNGISPDGSDLSEQLVTGVLTPVNIKNAIIIFYVTETTTEDISSMSEKDDDITMYQSYNMHVTIYGHRGMMLAPSLKARLSSQSTREFLHSKAIHLVEVTNIEDGTELINNVMWPRKDFDITVSVRYSIEPISVIDDMKSIKINDVYSDNELKLLDIKSTLNNNSWSVIRKVCEAGKAADYWHLGDTKEDVGLDGRTRIFRIVDMQGLYNKHVVFEELYLEPITTPYGQNETGTLFYNYTDSYLKKYVLPGLEQKLSIDLQQNLTPTRFGICSRGRLINFEPAVGPLIYTEDKLFIVSKYEMFTHQPSPIPVSPEENLTMWQYYVEHQEQSDTTKRLSPNGAGQWTWLRTVYSASDSGYVAVEGIYSNGTASTNASIQSPHYFFPCFSF